MTSTINYGKNLRAIVCKLVAQMCAKIGGIPWTVDDLPFFNERTMVCGLDVYHDTESENGISTYGFVASYNRTCTKFWPSSAVMPKAGDELCLKLKQVMIDALVHFESVNGCLPQNVIFFRDAIDGVPLSVIRDQEVSQLTEALNHMSTHQTYIKLLFTLV